MNGYRAYFLDEGNTISDSATLLGASDDDAVELAEILCAQRAGCVGFELWQSTRAVRLFAGLKTRCGGTGRSVSVSCRDGRDGGANG